MDVIVKSNPPFIIKTYDKYFTISENFDESDIIQYSYDQLSAVVTKYGRLNWLVTIGNFLVSLISARSPFRPEKDYDELIIIFKNGKIETRYLATGSIQKLAKVVEHIATKI